MRKSARLGAYRRKKSRERSESNNTAFFKALKVILVIALVFVGLFLFIGLNTKYWDGRNKVAFAFQVDNGNVGVLVADPSLDELTMLTIPGDTEVNVAEDYGTFRIKNVWQLSRNENLGGRLLPETIMQNFYFPLNLWSGPSGIALARKDFKGVVGFVFSPNSTNIPFGDRLRLSLFALGIQSLGKNDINLGESQFLRKENLKDGQPGYRLNGPSSERLTVYFSDNEMSQALPKVYVIDQTGRFGVAELVGRIVEVMGGKVVSIDKREVKAVNCEVRGRSKSIVSKVANIFSCKVGSGSSDFDIEINLGSDFAKRF